MTLTNKTASKAGRSKFAKARKQLTPAELFFFEHAGYSYDPKTETPEQGRIRCAKDLATAEQYASEHGWFYHWLDDYDEDCGCGNTEPHETLGCVLKDANCNTLESLWGICEPRRNYGRVVEAELAFEAMDRATKHESNLAESVQHMN